VAGLFLCRRTGDPVTFQLTLIDKNVTGPSREAQAIAQGAVCH
jgi:hypothetical protein